MAMRIYHLSYDVRDSKVPASKTILDRIAAYIEKELSGAHVVRPVASTLVFATELKWSDVLNGIRNKFGTEIFYVLSMSAITSDNTKHFIWMHENMSLTENFRAKHFSV